MFYIPPANRPVISPAPLGQSDEHPDPPPHRRPVSRPDYPRLRSQAYRLAENDAAALIPPVHVRITEIDRPALAAFTQTWEGRHWSGYGGFEWPYLWHRHGRQDRTFHCALWHESMLCGLAIGSVPRGHSHLTIHYIEARPQGHPLRGHVAYIALTAAEYYADGLGLTGPIGESRARTGGLVSPAWLYACLPAGCGSIFGDGPFTRRSLT